MAVPLIEITQKQLDATIKALSNAGATVGHAAWLRRKGRASCVVAFMEQTMECNARTFIEIVASFTTSVDYIQPGYSTLKRRFRRVDPRIQGKRFEAILRWDVGRTRRTVRFEVVRTLFMLDTDEILDILERRGLRPAIYQELIGFARRYPWRERPLPRTDTCIFALGSVTPVGGNHHRHLVELKSDGSGLELSACCGGDGGGYAGGFYFLAVHKDA